MVDLVVVAASLGSFLALFLTAVTHFSETDDASARRMYISRQLLMIRVPKTH